MKTRTLTLMTLILTAFAGNAFAAAQDAPYSRDVFSTSLKNLELDEKLDVMKPADASVFVDMVQEEVRLVIQPAWNCPKNAMCLMVMPPVRAFDAPIVSQKADECGAIHTVALRDDRPRDGAMTRIEVIDNGRNSCKYFVAIPAVEVRLSTATLGRGGDSSTRSVLKGDLRLRRVR